MTAINDRGEGLSRRNVLRCMTWAGTAVVWTVAGGVSRSLGLVGETNAEEAGFTFVRSATAM